MESSLTRSQLARLISRDLSRRWLGNSSVINRRLRRITGSRARWTDQLAEALHLQFGRPGHAQQAALQVWLGRHPVMKAAFRNRQTLRVDVATANQINRPGYRWPVPAAANLLELTDLLCLRTPRAIDWLVRPHLRRSTSVDHYVRRRIPGRQGRGRWLHQPRPLLMRVQRCIAREILAEIPLHAAAHAYRRGLSVRDCAAPHVGHRVVLKIDLENFFGTISLRRVTALFRAAGYPDEVAVTLGRLCTVPARTPSGTEDCRIAGTCLPQGGPASPAISNAIAFQMDRRLAGLASSVGAWYTRYADDLLFSGGPDLASRIDRVATTVCVIAMDEGFQVQHRKTRKMYSGDRQRLLGLNVNTQLSTDRSDFELLKAILTNCQRQGWRSQNRDQHPEFRLHLQGRIAHIGQTNPGRYQKLARLFDAIDWT